MPDLIRHPVRLFWIPASAGMTDARQAAGNGPEGIQNSNFPKKCLFSLILCFGHLDLFRISEFLLRALYNFFHHFQERFCHRVNELRVIDMGIQFR